MKKVIFISLYCSILSFTSFAQVKRQEFNKLQTKVDSLTKKNQALLKESKVLLDSTAKKVNIADKRFQSKLDDLKKEKDKLEIWLYILGVIVLILPILGWLNNNNVIKKITSISQQLITDWKEDTKALNERHQQQIERIEANHKQIILDIETSHLQEVRNALDGKRNDINTLLNVESKSRSARSNISVLVITSYQNATDLEHLEINKKTNDIRMLFKGKITKINFIREEELNVIEDHYDIYLFNNAVGTFPNESIEKHIKEREDTGRKTTYFYFTTKIRENLSLKNHELEKQIDKNFAKSNITLYYQLMDTMLYHWLYKTKYNHA